MDDRWRLWLPLSLLLLAGAAATALVGAAAPALAEQVPLDRFVELSSTRSRRGAFAEPAGGPLRRGLVPLPAPAGRVKPVWTLQLRMRSLTAPVQAADGTLYVGGDAGVAAVSELGRLRWLAKVGPVAQAPTVLPGGGVLVVAGGRLQRLRPDGVASEPSVGLRVAGGLLRTTAGEVWLATPGGQMQLLDRAGTRVLAIAGEPARAYRWAAVGDEVVAVGPPRRLHLLSPVGGLRRTLALPHAAAAGPVSGPGGTVWTVGTDGSLLGHAPAGGLRARVHLGAGRSPQAPAVGGDGALRVGASLDAGLAGGARQDALLGLDAGGAERFRLPLDGPPGPVTLARGDVALVVTRAGTLYVVEADGRLRFRQGLRARGRLRPVLGAGGRLYVADPVGRLTAWQ